METIFQRETDANDAFPDMGQRCAAAVPQQCAPVNEPQLPIAYLQACSAIWAVFACINFMQNPKPHPGFVSRQLKV